MEFMKVSSKQGNNCLIVFYTFFSTVHQTFRQEWDWNRVFLLITMLHTLAPILTVGSVSLSWCESILICQFIIIVIVVVNNFYGGKRFTFSMDFRTLNCSGILLYVATPLYPEHVLLELLDGRVRDYVHNFEVKQRYIIICLTELCLQNDSLCY